MLISWLIDLAWNYIGLRVNGEKILTGRNKDSELFWLDKDNQRCDDNSFMSTTEISIQNGEIMCG